MRNLWLIAKHEYRETALKRAFLLFTFGIPLGMLALIVVAVMVEESGASPLPLGYVDHSGQLDLARYAELPDPEDRVTLRAFADEASAQLALEQEQVQAVFVFPADYPTNIQTDLYFLDSPPEGGAWSDMDDFVRLNLVGDYPEDLRTRLFEGPDVTVHDLASGRTFSESGVVNIILPFVASFFLFFSTMSASGYLLGVVANEKENRTMEVLVTSVTPWQLIVGKALGLFSATLTQLAIYVVAAVVGLVIGGRFVPELQQVQIPWAYIGLMAAFFLPTYLLISGLMIAIGSSVSELEQGQQVAGLLNLLFILPIFFTPLLFENPGSPPLVALTLFPTTAFLAVSLRWGLGTVPVWQLALSWGLLVTTAALTIGAAARIFRMGRLHYGQPLSLKAALVAIRGR